jgi:hypothetical protein
MDETWADVVGHVGRYQVSNLGRVRSVTRVVEGFKGSHYTLHGRVLKPVQTSASNRYLVVCLSHGKLQCNASIHRLVLEAFHGPCPKGMQCCHLDGDPQNNRVDNLRWGTPKANAGDREFHGRTARGWKLGVSKTSTETRWAIVDLHEQCGYTVERLTRIFHRSAEHIEYLLNHKPDQRVESSELAGPGLLK